MDMPNLDDFHPRATHLDAEALTLKLDGLLARLKRVRRSGNGYLAECPAHTDWEPSLSITQSGCRILLYCFGDCSLESVCDALGIRVADLFGADSRTDIHRFSDAERKAWARKLWSTARWARGSMVERYLRNRGITLTTPFTIRSTLVRCDDWPRAMRWPALIAAIQDVKGAFAGVQITALCADGSAKAPTETPRKIHGPYRGGAVRLSDQLNAHLYVAEGLETALSVQQATGITTWAALGTSNLVKLELPQAIREVTIAADPDDAGEAAAQTLARRLLREGREVRIARPPQRRQRLQRHPVVRSPRG
jgi:hypothetical protein